MTGKPSEPTSLTGLAILSTGLGMVLPGFREDQ
jgi:hypothetical protein